MRWLEINYPLVAAALQENEVNVILPGQPLMDDLSSLKSNKSPSIMRRALPDKIAYPGRASLAQNSSDLPTAQIFEDGVDFKKQSDNKMRYATSPKLVVSRKFY